MLPLAMQLKVAYMKGMEFIPGSHLGLLSTGLGKTLTLQIVCRNNSKAASMKINFKE